MFTKRKHLGSAHAFRTVVDWEAILGAILLGGFLIFLFAA